MPVAIIGSEDDRGPDQEEQRDFRLDDLSVMAAYKIEIILQGDRSVSSLKTSVGMLLAWESGRRLHGGGDDQMYWCGYEDCKRIMESDNFAMFTAICPHCHRESFLDPDSKAYHIKELRERGDNADHLRAMPIVSDKKLFNLSARKLAELVHSIWLELGSNADIYLKHYPKPIRYDPLSPDRDALVVDHLNKAREVRVKGIYPLKNIIKDMSAGADPLKRFHAFLTA